MKSLREIAVAASTQLTPVEGPGTLHLQSRRDGMTAVLLTVALAALYFANGDVLPGHDATPNAFAAAHTVDGEGLTFTPSGSPLLYDWYLLAQQGPQYVRVADLSARFGRLTARDLWRSGVLVPGLPYYLAETPRFDPVTGEHVSVGIFGVGTAISAVPVFAAVRAWCGSLVENPDALWVAAKLSAALFTALAAGLLYVACRSWTISATALLLTIAFALGTPAWSMSSQTLWQHPSNELFIALGALMLIRSEQRLSACALAGAAFAAAAACRPTSVLFAATAAAWLFLTNRRSFLAFCGGAAPFAIGIAGYNFWYLGSPFRFGQADVASIALAKTGSPEVWPMHVGSSLAGLLFSPSRGLFVYSPFLILAPVGAVLAFRDRRYVALRPLAIAAALEVVVASAHFDWWGGWSYGWRRLADLGPVLVLLVLPTLAWIRGAVWRNAAFTVALAWSVLVQAIGAFAYDPSGWNARPGFRFAEPSGGFRYTVDEEGARTFAVSPGAVERVELDIDKPEYRNRLWSVTDNQVVWSISHLGDAVRRRRAASRDWVDQWRR